MQLLRASTQRGLQIEKNAATIGNFDGVHIGHQQVFLTLVKEAKKRGLKTSVIVFEPTSKEFFLKKNAPARLCNLRDKYHLIKACGIEYLICLHFNHDLAKMGPRAFIEQVLLKQLNVRYLIVGDDFRFGRNREGNLSLLQQVAAETEFEVANISGVMALSDRVSSTRVREALMANDLNAAEKMLGRPYSVNGKVTHGDKLGRQLGFPTANIGLGRTDCPLRGVFAVEVADHSGGFFKGVANIGMRPTVGGIRLSLEVYLLNFEGNVYGNLLYITFRKKMRDEQKFASLEELKEQIHKDVIRTREYFGL